MCNFYVHDQRFVLTVGNIGGSDGSCPYFKWYIIKQLNHLLDLFYSVLII